MLRVGAALAGSGLNRSILGFESAAFDVTFNSIFENGLKPFFMRVFLVP